jgi:hypothetical protein
MTPTAKLMTGIILLTMPSIQYGGYFLLQVLGGRQNQLQLTIFQKSMFRAGHAHAGVLVILAILVQLLTDYVQFPNWLEWGVRVGFPFSAILISGGFFASAIGQGIQQPNKNIRILYVGVFLLAAVLLILGVGLIVN